MVLGRTNEDELSALFDWPIPHHCVRAPHSTPDGDRIVLSDGGS